MDKIYGATERNDRVQQIGRKRYEVFYGYVEEGDDAYQFRQTVEHKPTFEEVKEMILAQINANVQDNILQGMRYLDRIVWLSSENQRNIAFAYALAKGGDIRDLPTLKLGTDDDYLLHTFENAEEVIAFAVKVQSHIEQCVNEGRLEKDLIDWTRYENF